MVFDKQWFQKHNNTLCWFANAPVIKYWFRWLLRIHNDVSWNTKINQITPNSFTYNGKIVGDKVELTTDFRTHEKFGKRLYYGLKPLWYLLHLWDWSTSIQPILNCGFDTLTQYPGSTSANNPVDGRIQRDGVNETYSTIRSGAGVTVNYTEESGTCTSLKASTTSNQYQQMGRSIYCYDTSSIDDGATISAADMWIYKISSVANLGVNEAVITQLATPASTSQLVAEDFDNIETISSDSSMYMYGSGTLWTNNKYNSCSNVASAWRSGFSDINKAGITKFGMRFLNDASPGATTYSWSSGAEHSITVYFANQTGTTNDPKLVVTYTTVVGPANIKTYKGLAAASVKTCKGLAIASVKSKKGLV